jgi:hypothetical protein
MNKDEAILKIKDQLKKLMAFSAEAEMPATEEVKCESVKLKDGSEIMIPTGSNIEPGVEVYMVDDAGNQTPCEDGSYELENGQTITVSGGMIDGVADTTQPEGEQTQSPEGDAKMAAATPGAGAEAAKEGETPAQEEAENMIGDRVAALEQQIAQILELLQGMSNAQEMAMSKINEIAEAPAAPSIKVGKSVGSSTAKVEFSSTKDEISELNKLKNKFKINGNGGYAFNAATSK